MMFGSGVPMVWGAGNIDRFWFGLASLVDVELQGDLRGEGLGRMRKGRVRVDSFELGVAGSRCAVVRGVVRCGSSAATSLSLSLSLPLVF
jgi:hypothetical protein